MWYNIRAAQDSQHSEIVIYDEIGMWGITARDFVSDVKALGLADGSALNLRINSPGGSVFDGIAIKNYLASHYAVNVYIDGIAASIASIIALAGKRIEIAEDAMVMIHNPSIIALGDAEELRKTAGEMDQITDILISAYAARMNVDSDEIRNMMAEQTLFGAQEAIDIGYADSMYERKKVAASFTSGYLANLPHNVRQRFCHNSLPDSPGSNDKPNGTMSKQNNPGDVTPEARFTEADVTAKVAEAADAARTEAQETASQAAKAEGDRIKGITALAKQHNLEAKALDAIAEGKSVEDFKSEALAHLSDELANARRNTPTEPAADDDVPAAKVIKLDAWNQLNVAEQNAKRAAGYTITD